MLRRGDPVGDGFLEFLGGHARVGGHDHFEQGVFATGQRGFHIAFEDGGEWLLVFPLGVLRRQLFDPVEDKERLEIHRLLGPEPAVVVERGDAFRHRDEVRGALCRHLLDKLDDCLLGRGVVPRGQWVGGAGGGRAEERDRGDDNSFHGHVA
jgi:hypothetical protein